jgi:Domain of unknown function (DUF4333)
MRFSLAVPAIAGGLLLAGCSTTTIDQKKAEKFVTGSINGAQSTSCPDGVDAEKGKTLTCTITYTDGTTSKATLHITSDDGKVNFKQSDVTPPS